MIRIILLFSFFSLSLISCTKIGNKPNVILFVVDDLGWTDLACYGSDLYQTPNVDQLASEGMRFTDGYASCTVCSPSRASIMTGKYPAKINCTDWIEGHKRPFAKLKVPDWTMYMKESEITLAEALKAEGYKTIHLGKWHLGETPNYWPENQGFEVNIGGYSKGSPQRREGGNGYFSPYANPRLPDGPKGEYLTERLAKEAVAFLDAQKNSDQPFFMNFWFYNVHTPIQARQEKIDKYKKLINEDANHKNPIYAAMVEHMDDGVGAVMNKLAESGLDQNTIIIFTSDNGGLRAMNRNWKYGITSNAPLRTGKGDMYEGGVRVPFIVKWNGKIQAGICKTPIISADIYPTILGLTGVKGDEKQNSEMDGVSFADLLLKGKAINRDALYWHYPHYHSEGATPYSAIRKGDWKLIQVFEDNDIQLYNLKEDLGETKNVCEKYPEKMNELLTDLSNWRESMDAQYATKNPDYDERFEKVGIKRGFEAMRLEDYKSYLEKHYNK